MTREEIEELKGLAASMGLYDDKNPCKRAVILGKAIKALEQEKADETTDHPEWIDYEDGLWKYAKCPVCGSVRNTKTPFCPICGTKMKVHNK